MSYWRDTSQKSKTYYQETDEQSGKKLEVLVTYHFLGLISSQSDG